MFNLGIEGVDKKLDTMITEMNQLKKENMKLKEHVVKQKDSLEKLESEIRDMKQQ